MDTIHKIIKYTSIFLAVVLIVILILGSIISVSFDVTDRQGIIWGATIVFTFILLLLIGAWMSTTESLRESAQEATREYARMAAEEKENKVLAKRQRDYVRAEALKYQDHLAIKRIQLLIKDDYGDIDLLPWRKELVFFLNNKLGEIPENIALKGKEKTIDAGEIAEIIDQVAKQGEKKITKNSKFSTSMTGIEYEHFCAHELRRYGWDTVVSQASGDQGVDVIAKKNNIVAAIQCKKYSSAIGNKAVQEVVSGKIHYGADYAVVVTNSTFTPAAKKLANTSRVLLLHHTQLKDLDDTISKSEGR